MNTSIQELTKVGNAPTSGCQSRTDARIRVLFATLAFVVYSAAVLLQGQYFRSQWHAEANSIVAGISHVTYGAEFGIIDSNVLKIITLTPLDQRVGVYERLGRGELESLERFWSLNPSTEKTIATDGIGIGYLVFAILTMKLFGTSVISLPLAFLTLLGLSTAAFIVRYRDQRLFAVPLQFLALTFMLLTLHNTDPHTVNEGPIGGYRYLTVLAILPAIHIFFELLDTHPRRLRLLSTNLGLVAFQVCLLSFVIMVRVAIGYVLIPIIIAALLGIWWGRFHIKYKILQVLTTLVASALIIGAMILSAPTEYKETGRLFGNVWHRILISTSMRSSWPYGKLQEMFDCRGPFILPLGTQRYDAFGHCVWWAAKIKEDPSQLTSPAESATDYYDKRYEKVMRDAFFQILQAYPLEVFETLYYDKSIVLMQTLRSALIIKWSNLFVVIIPIFVIQCIVFVVFVVTSACFSKLGAAEILPLLCLFGLSLIPPYIAWGVLEGVTDTILFMYEVIAACVAVLIHSVVIALRARAPVLPRALVAGAGTAVFLGIIIGVNFYNIGVVAHPLIVPIFLNSSEPLSTQVSEVNEPATKGLRLHSATYGGNCGAPTGNATGDIAKTCNGKMNCDYIVDVDRLRDPAPRCSKDFVVEYSCAPETALLRKDLPAEAGLRSRLELNCSAPSEPTPRAEPVVVPTEPVVASGLNIRTATYGGNCGAPAGNATPDIAKTCNGQPRCDYVVDVDRLRDPAPRCSKDFVVEYSCAPDTALLRRDLPAEAGLRSRLDLNCSASAERTPPAEPVVVPTEPVVASGLNIRSATYGGNCGAPAGNATKDLTNSCGGRTDCTYVVDVDRLRDPAPRCSKDFVVEYSCAPETALVRKDLPAEAGLRSRLELSCLSPASERAAPAGQVVVQAEPTVASGLNIRSATYGGNCGAPAGNATRDIARACNGQSRCDYIVDVDRLRDPAPRCSKDFVVEYSCAPDTAAARKDLPAEAGLGSRIELNCSASATERAAPTEQIVVPTER